MEFKTKKLCREQYCPETIGQKFMKSLPIIACVTLMILGVFTLANWAFTLANWAFTLFNQTSDLTGQPDEGNTLKLICEGGKISTCKLYIH